MNTRKLSIPFALSLSLLALGGAFLVLTARGNVAPALAAGPIPTLPLAATRYVAPTGDDSGDCTVTPCASIAYALAQSGDGDTITVAAGVYTESGILVDDDVTIRGQGPEQTIVQAHANPGQAADRVFEISLSVAAATIQDMTIRHGRAAAGDGGGIHNHGSLTLTHVVVCCNAVDDGDGGGIANTYNATLTLNDTSVISNTASSAYGGGGGIANGGAATLVRSAVSSNTVQGYGGGIYNGLNDSLTMTETIVSGNTATKNGGGVKNGGQARIARSAISGNHSGGYGGGIYAGSPTAISNSTISGNTANQGGGGVYAPDSDSSVMLRNSTVVNNTADADANGSGRGGGLNAFDGDITLRSAIVVANRRGTTADDCYHNPLGSGYFESLGYNLVGSGSGCPVSYATDKTTTDPAAELDLTLADNGGATPTHALALLGSQAAEGGDCSAFGLYPAITQDQRGRPRPVDHDNDGDARCDKGAFELQSIVAEISPTLGSTLSYVDSQGLTTTVEAPTNAVSSTTALVYTPLDSPTHGPPAGFSLAGHAFTLDAYVGGSLQAGFAFSRPVTVTLHYSDADVAGTEEMSLTLNYWAGSQWLDAATTCTPTSIYERHPDENWLAVSICHLSEFALIAPETGKQYIYLPLVLRNYAP